MRNVKKGTNKTLPIRSELVESSPLQEVKEEASSVSHSPLADIYASEEFRLAWENEISHHVAMHVLRLRRYRRLSQARVAKRMGTSQAKLARIEGGDENITLRTLKRLARALRARIRFALEPAELSLPSLPAWWEQVTHGLVCDGGTWRLRVVLTHGSGSDHAAAAGWTAAPQHEQHQRHFEITTAAMVAAAPVEATSDIA